MLGFLSPRPKGESKSTTNQPAGAREHHHCNKTPAEGELYSKIVVRPSSSATNRTKEPTKPKESTSDDRQLAIQLEREEATARVSDLENKLKQGKLIPYPCRSKLLIVYMVKPSKRSFL